MNQQRLGAATTTIETSLVAWDALEHSSEGELQLTQQMEQVSPEL